MCILSDLSREKDSDIREGKTFHDLADSELIVSIDEAGYIDEQKNEIHQSISAHLDDYTKSILTRIGNSLHFFANGKSITYIPYIFGYFLLFLYGFYEFTKSYPLSALILSAVVTTLTLATKKDLACIEIKKFFDWINFTKLLIPFLIFIYIYFVFFKGWIFDFIRLIVPSKSSFLENLVYSLSFLDYVCILFSVCFLYELSVIYKQNRKIFSFVFTKLVLPFSSFMLLFISRNIIVFCTGTEPAIFSRASTLFALASSVIAWPFLCVLFLSLLYIFYFIWGVAYGLISFFIKSVFEDEEKRWKSYFDQGFIYAGNATAALAMSYLGWKMIFNVKVFSFILVSLSPFLLYFYPSSYEVSLPDSQMIHLAETQGKRKKKTAVRC